MKENFEYLNQYYDKIYVLTLQRSGERRERFAKRFEGLNYFFFYGADKENFTLEDLISKGVYDDEMAKHHHRYNKSMRPGEIACAWSHRMIYEDVVKKNYQRVLILEDDAVPDPRMVKQIPFIIEEIPQNCNLLMWGWGKNGEKNIARRFKQWWYHMQHSLGFLKWDHKIISNLFARKYSKHIKKAGFHDYTYAYAITRSAAEKLIQLQTPLQYIADNLLGYAAAKSIIDGYITYPQVLLHDNDTDGRPRDSYIR